MKIVRWDDEKNALLIQKRNISFEQILYEIANNRIIDIVNHPNREKYSNQQIMIFNIKNYIYCVPFVENETEIFLKTIYPNRKLTKLLLGEKNE
jgi:uncharacterized DUF497 family protein